MRGALAISAALACLAAASWATTVVALSDEEILDRSSTVLIGEVLSVTSREIDDRRIITEVRVKVEECFFSDEVPRLGDEYIFENGEFVFRQWGGVVGSRRVVIHGAAQFEVGERVYVALEKTSDGAPARFCVGLSQGKYRIDGEVATRDMHGLSLLDRQQGTLEEGGLDRTKLENLRSFTRQYAQNRAAQGR